jgi:hypothetical protein
MNYPIRKIKREIELKLRIINGVIKEYESNTYCNNMFDCNAICNNRNNMHGNHQTILFNY